MKQRTAKPNLNKPKSKAIRSGRKSASKSVQSNAARARVRVAKLQKAAADVPAGQHILIPLDVAVEHARAVGFEGASSRRWWERQIERGILGMVEGVVPYIRKVDAAQLIHDYTNAKMGRV